MDTQNPIEENILKLVNEGYEVNDVYNIMTHLGWQPEDVQLSMNQIYERRAKENEAVARQRQEAIDQINASYEDLKKKSRATTIRFLFWDISWGVFCRIRRAR